MAVDFNLNATHMIAYPSKCIGARIGHTYNIVLTSDTDNGVIVSRGDYVSFDQYKQAAAPANFEGKIIDIAANSSYYIEVTKVDPQKEAIMIYETPIFTRDDRDMRQEKLWYNAEGETVEGIALRIGDIIEISPEGFDGTPAVGKSVTIVNKKYKVGA